MKTTKKITSEITDGKQIIRFSNTLGKTEYMISIILSAGGNGEKDIRRKLKALLEKEIGRQLDN